MARPDEGLKSEPLREALGEALAGKPARLEALLSHHGAVLTPTPNLRLAAAFGAELAAAPGRVTPLLDRLGREDAAPDDPRAFLPIAAAHGWVALLRVGREIEPAWAALADLAADERAPVRLGAKDALGALAQRDGGGDTLVARAAGWLDDEDRERRFGTAALVAEALGGRKLLATVRDHEALRAYLSRALAEVAGAPRSAERSDARRRLIAALPRALAGAVASASGGEVGRSWLEAECEAATHPAARAVLSDALLALGSAASGLGAGVVDTLRSSLAGSAKPPRDPTRIRPGSGRGKGSRRIR